VHIELSVVAKGHKYLTKKVRCRLSNEQAVELWIVKTQDVLDVLKQHGVKDDVLTLDVNIEIWQGNTTAVNFPDVKPLQNLNSQLEKMLTNQTLTDVTLKAKDREFKAHKVVLAATSPVFEAMFKESYKEHKDSYVNIEDIDINVFEVFLRYLYTGEVDKLNEMVSDLLVTADKYDVQPLKEICAQHLAKNVSVKNAVDILALAHRHSIESIKSMASVYLKENMFDVTRSDSWIYLFDNYVAKNWIL
jgi:speckle-type POZ protein